MEGFLLNDGYKIPVMGFGTYLMPPEDTKRCVLKALEVGYRLIDTARLYLNEEGVGEGVKESGLDRKDVFITTKIWTTDCYHDKTREAVEESLVRLGVEYIDLVLVHWPPVLEDIKGAWIALEEKVKEGKVRSIGVSNFKQHHIERLLEFAEIKPVINQIELHPYFQQFKLREYCASENIIVQAWAPLLRGKALNDKAIVEIAKKHDKTAANVVVRWLVQEGIIPIPKSVTDARIEENFQIFDFELDETDMEKMRHLDKNIRRFRDPDSHGF
ncbi:MAG TPA: aldo/keto reductase [Clostridia bacterium]|mgnify:CR=1 FL=1|jgi:diketogulonate reductase-like aldo/keto reductase|nr:aldo/keto reductase [Clostridia bacterium]